MAHQEEKFGASLEVSTPKTPARPDLALTMPPPYGTPSTPSLSQAQTPIIEDEYDRTSTHPCSAFYSHPTTRTSLEQLRNASTANVRGYGYDVDLEAAYPGGKSNRCSLEPSRVIDGSPGRREKDYSVWPARHSIQQRTRKLKRERGCRPLRGLNTSQKLWIKILIALLIVGIATGVGIGISKAVGAGIWNGNNSQQEIGGH